MYSTPIAMAVDTMKMKAMAIPHTARMINKMPRRICESVFISVCMTADAENNSPIRSGSAAVGLATLVPIGTDPKGPAFDTGDNVQHADCDGRGHHEDEGHGHPAYRQDDK